MMQRAISGDRMLVVDENFCLDGLRHTWRLRADVADQQARSWTLDLVRDCAAKVVTSWETGALAAPSQLIRCPPVLQLPEAALLSAGHGLRDAGSWPLPQPPHATLGR